MRRVKCIYCGKMFLQTAKNQKLCSDYCREEQRKIRDKQRQERRKLERDKKTSLVRKNQKARELGMSYGKYQAKLFMEKQDGRV